MKKCLFSLFVLISFVCPLGAQVLLHESFEGISFPPPGWSVINAGAGNDWTHNFNSSYASSGVKSMKYSFTSAAAANTWAFTPAIQLDSADSVTITFDQRVGLSTFAEAMKLTVGNAPTVASQTTILYSSNSLTNTLYTQRSTTFVPDSAGVFYFAFNCSSPVDRYILYVDNIRIFKPVVKDAAILSLSVATGCSLGSSEPVSVVIKNSGSDSLTYLPIHYSINEAPPVSEIITTSVAPGNSITYTFAALADLSVPGFYSIKAYTALPNDGDPYNDTITQITEHIQGSLAVKSSVDQVLIPDNSTSGANSVIAFCGLPTVLDGTSCGLDYLKIDSLNHSWISDLTIYLISPVNDSILVSDGNGGGTANIRNVIFKDSGNINIGTVNSGGIPSGVYHTESPAGLGAFNTGQDPNGDWKLCIKDNASGDVGKICKWTLAFTGVTSADADTKENESVLIYPNPTRNNITVDLRKCVDTDYIRIINNYGNVVYTKTIERSADKQIDLEVGQFENGVYFVQIIAGAQISTYKIIINNNN